LSSFIPINTIIRYGKQDTDKKISSRRRCQLDAEETYRILTQGEVWFLENFQVYGKY
jgi:hypothetical protein